MQLKLSKRIPILICVSAAVLAISVGMAGYWTGSLTARDLAREQQLSMTDGRATAVSLYMGQIQSHVEALASRTIIIDATREFYGGWKTQKSDHGAKLRTHYVDGNPFASEGNNALYKHVKGTKNGYYDIAHEKYHGLFVTEFETHGFPDMFVISHKGDVAYTLHKGDEFGTIISTGPLASTRVGQIATDILQIAKAKGPLQKSYFTDLVPYSMNGKTSAAFFLAPVFKDTRFVGILVAQLPMEKITTILNNPIGLGDTGQLVLAGEDTALRTTGRFDTGSVPLTTALNLPAISRSASTAAPEQAPGIALNGNPAQMTVVPVTYGAANWQIVAMLDQSEIDQPVVDMRNMMLIACLSMLLLVSVVAIILSNRITRRISRLTDRMGSLAEGDIEIELEDVAHSDEIGDMSRAVSVFRESAIERISLENLQKQRREKDALRQDVVQKLIGDFEGAVGDRLGAVANASEEVNSTAGKLVDIASDSEARAISAADASTTASENVGSMAHSVSELHISIGEISRQVNKSTEIVSRASRTAKTTQEKIGTLTKSAEKIGTVVSLIQDIAEQTNLLALNATIESARAGDYGKGFAVVAQEVKTLANQTANATGEISQQIDAIQAETEDTVKSINAITEVMTQMQEVSNAIASAVEEQGATAGAIAENAQNAVDGSEGVAVNIDHLSGAISETSQSAHTVKETMGRLAEQTEIMKEEIELFLDKVGAA